MVWKTTNNRTIFVLKDYDVINISGIIKCSIKIVTRTNAKFIVPTSESVSEGIVCFSRWFSNFYCIAVMIINGFNNCTVIVKKSNRIVDIYGRVCCGIGRICYAINHFLIPTRKAIRISVVSCLGGRLRNYNFLTVIIGIGADNHSVFILKNNSVFHICRNKFCGISSITFTRSNSFIPTYECIGIGFIRRFGRCRRNNYRITVVIGIRAQHIAIVILENNGIVGISNIVCCDIGRITYTINDFLIPSLKRIRANHI